MSTIYEGKVPKPRRGVGSAAATRKWRLNKDINEMREKRLAREKQGAKDFLERRRQMVEQKPLSETEWGRRVAFNALDAVVAVSRVADGLEDVRLIMTHDPEIETENSMAATDFKAVHIGLGYDVFPKRDDTPMELADKIATLKGMAYHEVGHIRFTMRPWDLWTSPEQRHQYHMAWNILEDQRMESWSARLNKRVGGLFTIMIHRLIAGEAEADKDAVNLSWILLAGRDYLPMDVLEASYDLCPWKDREKETWFQIVARYKRARDERIMRRAVQDAYEFLMRMGVAMQVFGIDLAVGDHNTKMPADGKQPGGPTAKLGDEQGEGDAKSAAEATGKDGKDDKDGNGPQAGKDAPLTVTDQSLLDKLLKARQDAVEDFSKRSDVQTAVSSVADVGDVETAFPEPPDRLCRPMDATVQAEAEAIAEGMKRALASFSAATDPSWEVRVDTGVLDALPYRTREPGDRDYRRRFVHPQEGKGRDVHVSMLCDVSGSMSGPPMLALSMVLYGVARACDDLNITRSFNLWSTEYYDIWNGREPDPVVWNSFGGTNPIPALDSMEFHNREEAANHLVLIFTDGAWYSQAPLTTWGAPGRKIVVLHYGSYRNSEDLGADEEIRISNVMEIPDLLAERIGEMYGD